MKYEKIGNHTIINADTNVGMQELVDNNYKFDFILTSPPYNAHRFDNYFYTSGNINDKKTHDEYTSWLISHFKLYNELLAENGVVLFNLNYISRLENTASNLYKNIVEIENETEFILIDIICWKKERGHIIRNSRLTRVYENVFVFIRKSEWKSFNEKYSDILVGKPNFIEAPNNDGSSDVNKATFSSDLVVQLLKTYGATPETTVLDNFIGTGTTAVGCEKIGCKSVGIELDVATYDYAVTRIREYIGDFENLKEDNLFNI